MEKQSIKWSELLQQSNLLKKPTSVDHLLKEQETLELQQCILDVFRTFLKQQDLHLGIKVYIDQQLRQDIVHKMSEKPPNEEDTILSWTKRVFGDKKFGVVLNSLEFYDNALSEKMACITAPLIAKAGLPLGGTSFLFFMGNYGFTPFGIHKESKGEEGFLFHLGPAEKTFYTWDKEELNKIEHNAKVFHEVDKMLPDSEAYQLSTGSAMFIPHHVYHIANTNEFSMSLVMDYINPSQTRLLQDLTNEISSKESIKTPHQYISPLLSKSENDKLDSIINPQIVQENFGHAFNHYINRLKSNCGIKNGSKINSDIQIPNGDFELAIAYPFSLILSGNSLFARGHEFTVKPHPKFKFMVEKLNQGESIDLKMIQETLIPEWDMIDIYGLLGKLLQSETVIVKSINN